MIRFPLPTRPSALTTPSAAFPGPIGTKRARKYIYGRPNPDILRAPERPIPAGNPARIWVDFILCRSTPPAEPGANGEGANPASYFSEEGSRKHP